MLLDHMHDDQNPLARRVHTLPTAGLLLLVGFALWALNVSSLSRFLHFFTFQVRDLTRANLLAQGRLILFGPETTGGGNLPGPFYYVLLMISRWFGEGYWPAFYLLVVFAVAVAAIGAIYLARRVSLGAALLWVGLVVLSAPLENFITVFLNVSYQSVFVTLILFSAGEAFTAPGAQRRGHAFGFALFVLGLTIQLHYSALMLLPALLTLFLLAPRLRLARPSPADVAWGGILFLLPLLPYGIWLVARRQGWNVGQGVMFSGETRDALPSMLAFSEWPPFDRFVHGCDFLLNAMPLALPISVVAVLLSRLAPPDDARVPKDEITERRRGLVWVAGLCALWTLIPALYVFIAPIGYRYGMSFTLSALMLAALLISDLRFKRQFFVFLMFAAIAGLVLILYVIGYGRSDFALALDSRHWLAALALLIGVALRWPACVRSGRFGVLAATLTLAVLQNPALHGGTLANHEIASPTWAHWHNIGVAICERTGWTADEMMDRLYIVGGHMEIDPRSIFRGAAVDCDLAGELAYVRPPNGFFLSFKAYHGEEDVETWLARQPIAPEILAGLANGDIELGQTEMFNSVSLTPYRIRKPELYPESFHDTGVGYFPSRWQAYLQMHRQPGGVSRLDNGALLLTFNECPNAASYCTVGVKLEPRTTHGRSQVRVTVLGDSLGQNSPWITPAWTVSWDHPYVELSCGTRRQTIELAQHIGYRPELSLPAPTYAFFLSNHSLLTPYVRVLDMDCAVDTITVGRQSATVDRLGQPLVLGPIRRSVSL